MPDTQLVHEGDYVPYTNGGTARDPGDVVALPDGRAGVVGPDGLDANEEGNVHVAGGAVYRMPAVSSGAISAGATVEWSNSSSHVVADTAGDFDVGIAFAAKADGEDEILVALNE